MEKDKILYAQAAARYAVLLRRISALRDRAETDRQNMDKLLKKYQETGE